MRLESDFSRGETPLHHLDGRARLVAAGVFALVVAVFLKETSTLTAALALAALLAALSRPSPMRLLRRMAAVNVFVLFLWLVLPWSTPGEAVWRLGPFSLREEGILLCAAVTLKCNAILLAMIALLATCELHELAAAMRRLGMPARLVVITFLCARYLHLIWEEGRRVRQAAELRGFVPRTSPATYRTSAGLVGSLLVRSHERAARVYRAMLCRGFSGSFPRAGARPLRVRDVLISGGIVAFAITSGAIDWLLRN